MSFLIFRAEIVRWVAESKWPFKVVEDRGFQHLIKTGRPEYYIPSAKTVSRDVKKVFVNVCKHMVKMLQVSEQTLAGIEAGWCTYPKEFKFQYRWVDFTKPQGICSCDGPFRGEWHTHVCSIGPCRGRGVTLWPEPCCSVCTYPGWVWNIWQGIRFVFFMLIVHSPALPSASA